jgi:hypothetical protein
VAIALLLVDQIIAVSVELEGVIIGLMVVVESTINVFLSLVISSLLAFMNGSFFSHEIRVAIESRSRVGFISFFMTDEL